MKQLGYTYLIIYAFLLAFISVFIRHIHDMDIQTIAFMRALLAVVFIICVIVVQRDWTALKLVELPNTLIVGIAHSGMLLLYIGAFMNTTVANTVLLTYMAPCFALLFAKFYFKQEIPSKTFGNLAFSLVGLILVAGPQDLSLHSQEMLGNLLALGAGITYAVMMVWSKPLSQKVTRSYIVFWQHLVATIVLLPVASLGTEALLLENALPLAGLGFLSTGLAFLLLMFGVRLVPTYHALIMTSMEPVIAIGVAALFLQESLTFGTIIGAGLIVFGAYRIMVDTSEAKQAIGRTQSADRFGHQFGYFVKHQKKMSITTISDWLYRQVQHRHAILLPMRLFIGLGWLRSSIEKLLEPEWYSGVALHKFFFERIAEGDVAFPFYQFLMEGIFSTHAPFLSKLIMVGEFYCGIAILFGFFMRSALLTGMVMNLNFVLAGSVNPSAFYIIIQLTLLASAVGEVFGFDALLRHKNSTVVVSSRKLERAKVPLYFFWSLICGLLQIPVSGYVRTLDPAHSVEDPAVLLLLLLGLHGLFFLILGGQALLRLRNMRNRVDTDARSRVILPIRQNPIPEYIPQRVFDRWEQVAVFEQS